MSARSRSGILTAGLILIVLGVIFTVESFYAPFSALRLIARYWPLIMVIIGVKRIIGFFTWPEIPPAPEKASSKE